MLETFYQSSFFPSVTLKAFASINCSKMYLNFKKNDACDTCQYRHKWGKFGPLYLLDRHSNLSCLLHFLKQTSGRKHLNELNLKKLV